MNQFLIFHILLQYIYNFNFVRSSCLLEMEGKKTRREGKGRTRIKGKVNEETLLRLPNDSFFSRLLEAGRSYSAKYKNSFAYKHTSYRIQE